MKSAGLGLMQLRFVAAGLGPVGWTGIGALVAAAVVAFAVTPGLDHDIQAQSAELAALRVRLEQLRDPRAARAAREPVAVFIASLPSEAQVPELVAAIQRSADQGAVQVDRTEYRSQALFGQAVRRYRLSFPAQVDYPHLRAWLEGLLHDYPNLSVDEITLRRVVDGGEELEAHIGMSFLVREGR